jgi:hypothetical protein
VSPNAGAAGDAAFEFWRASHAANIGARMTTRTLAQTVWLHLILNVDIPGRRPTDGATGSVQEKAGFVEKMAHGRKISAEAPE